MTTIWMEAARELSRSGRFDLPRNGTMRLRAGRGGLVLRVEGGTVLVTREGDRVDHVAAPGRELRVTGPGLVVVWALEASALAVDRAAAAPRALGRAAWASSL
jgi:DUF2917 family protein